MTNAHRDLATPELWIRSLERSRRRRELLPKAGASTTAGSTCRRRWPRRSSPAPARPSRPRRSRRRERGGRRGVARQPGDRDPRGRAAAARREPGRARRSRPDEARRRRRRHLRRPDRRGGAQVPASAGLDVDGIVGPSTWSSLFEQAGASGASHRRSNVPPEVKQRVEQKLQQAGQELAAQGDAGAGTRRRARHRHDHAERPRPTRPRSPTTQAPAGGTCGSSTISTPVKGTVTSPYGPRWGRNHDGIDISAPTGTPVRAAACGTVSLAGQQSGYGNMVCITHTSQFSTCYAHLSRFGVSNGARSSRAGDRLRGLHR